MANVFQNLDKVTAEALRLMRNNMGMLGIVARSYEDQFGQKGAQIGDTLRVRKLSNFTVVDGQTMGTAQDLGESADTIVINKYKHIPFTISRQQATLNLNSFSKHVLEPMVANLVNYIDADLCSMYKDVAAAVGTIATTPGTSALMLSAGEKLDDMATPRDKKRKILLNPAAQAATVEGMKGFFHAGNAISEQFRKGEMGDRVLGFDFGMSQNINVHTVGALGGTPLVNGASQTGTSLVTDGWTASVTGLLKAGDIIQVPTMYSVNWLTKANTGKPADLVVTADVNSNGSGQATIPIKVWPFGGGVSGIQPSGAYQNVTGSPADNAPITVFGIGAAGQAAIAGKASPQNLAFHPEAFAFAAVPIDTSMSKDAGAKISTITDAEAGLSLSLAMQYDIASNFTKCRLDVLYGYKVLRGELACRILG